MAEYLSPGVYVEELELGPRPIEGVSTSTAGTVGVTERGPEDVPILVTSFADYQRLFGGHLDPRDFEDTWYLPLSVEGFFQNGGKRLYVVRTASQGAETASVPLMNRGAPTAYASPLEVRVQAGDQFLLVSDVAALAGGETLRIDDGAATEYVTAGPIFPATSDRVATLAAPAYAAYAGPDGAAGEEVVPIPHIAEDGVVDETLAAPAAAGSTRIVLSAPAGLSQNDVLLIADPADAQANEYAIVELAPAQPAGTTVTLRHPLAFAHPQGATVKTIAEGTLDANATSLSQAVSPGSPILVLDDATVAAPGDTVRIGGPPDQDAAAAYHFLAELHALDLEAPAGDAHPVGERVEKLELNEVAGTGRPLASDADEGDDAIRIDPNGLAEDDWIEIDGAEYAQIAEVPAAEQSTVRLRQPLRGPHQAGDQVVRQERVAGAYARLLQHLHPGATTVLLDASAPGDGDLVEIGEPGSPSREYRTLGPEGNLEVIPLAGSTAVNRAHEAGRAVELRARLLDLVALDRGGWGNGLRVTIEDEDPPLVQTASPGAGPMSNVPLASLGGVERGTLLEFLPFTTELAADAPAAATAVPVADSANIGPGDRLRIGRKDPEYVEVAAVAAGAVELAAPLRRAHRQREPVDPMGADGLPAMAKVEQRVGANAVRLEGGGLPAAVAPGTLVRSREFKLTIDWGKPNPRRPAEEIVVASEAHRNLTLDDRHSRYAGRAIGSVDGAIRPWDRRPEGGSDLVRVDDPLDSLATQTTIRTGPDLIFESLPGGRRRAAPRELQGGEDDNPGIDDDSYRGQDNTDPLLRTGLQCLKNEEDISLVAIPGRTSHRLQEQLITHCETMRYRFALLDSLPGSTVTGAQLPEVQMQRQRYDSKYAALYYPWLLRESPFTRGAPAAAELAIPPSGHMLGIFARTDVVRGVHKAPANEVVHGIRGLQRALTKGEHDVLNPSPININVLRDFREQNRGLRVWGARAITSDPAWRYINVRRLFNYIERSLEIGTQWVVFEPNDHHLWAQVRRSVSDFLSVVWRSGGLMGRVAEEAYFVKCDEETNTQADVDAGRLVVVVGLAPTKPAEFVVIRIGQQTGGSFVEED